MLDPVNFQHIYIHWPFCKKRCHYCDFVALAQHENFFESYHQALCKEIELVGKSLNSRQAIKTVFLGGGTPSLYPTHMLEEVFKTLNNYFDLSEVQEVTIEANPADITEEKLSVWKSFG
ncbi:MAG: radical SAM protein, partial [Candidatus Babeliales bacterium]